MSLSEIDACEDEVIQAAFLGGANVEAGDTLLFILHDGNLPSGILAWSNKPEFAFTPPLQTNTIYFISAIVGTIDQFGFVDLNDPCLSITEGTPIRFADIPEVELGPDLTISLGEVVELKATSLSNIESYNWFVTDTCIHCPSVSLHPLSTTTVKVEVSNTDGCLATDDITITVLTASDLDFPNVFSPNGDQINDVIFINSIKSIQEVKLFEIFDRWGNNVFQQKGFPPGSPSNGWDGTFQNKPLNPGVYLCRMTALMVNGDAQNFAWDVTLVR
jgi:gliding motility-associated-like protein